MACRVQHVILEQSHPSEAFNTGVLLVVWAALLAVPLARSLRFGASRLVTIISIQ